MSVKVAFRFGFLRRGLTVSIPGASTSGCRGFRLFVGKENRELQPFSRGERRVVPGSATPLARMGANRPFALRRTSLAGIRVGTCSRYRPRTRLARGSSPGSRNQRWRRVQWGNSGSPSTSIDPLGPVVTHSFQAFVWSPVASSMSSPIRAITMRTRCPSSGWTGPTSPTCGFVESFGCGSCIPTKLVSSATIGTRACI